MAEAAIQPAHQNRAPRPPALAAFAHVSVPCRDVAEARRFYVDVLGGALSVDTPTFASVHLGGVDIGFGDVGCSWTSSDSEYPHFAFFVAADQLQPMKDWLGRCGIPTSNFWTRHGVETLMFFRDPSGNVIELYCKEGFEGAADLPKGPPRGHGTAVDLVALMYDRWDLPDRG